MNCLLRFSSLKTSIASSSQAHILQTLRFATKKAGGSTKNGRDSIGRRLGLKKSGGEYVIAGNIVIRQRGFEYHPGDNIGTGKDHTLFALKPGYVKFKKIVDWKRRKRTFVSIVDENPNPGPYFKKVKDYPIRNALLDALAVPAVPKVAAAAAAPARQKAKAEPQELVLNF